MRTPVFPDHSPTVPALLRANRDRWADRDSVVTPDDRLTHRQLYDRSALLAARLVAAGAGKGTRVGILFPNGWEWVATWAAVARIGAIAVPVNTFYRPAELGRFLRHSDVQILAGVDRFLHHDYLANLESQAPELTEHGAGPLMLPSLPHLRRVLLWGRSDRAWASGDFGSVAPLPLPILEGLEDSVSPSDEMLVTYTSGSTGEPKGIIHGQGNLLRHARNLAALSGVDETSRIWTPMPLCWVGGFAFTLLRALSVGAAFVTQEVFDAGQALKLMEAERVTIVSGWPAVSKALAEHPSFAGTDLSAIRAGSFYDALPADRRPPDPGLVIGSLGMSETGGPHTFWTADEEPTGPPPEFRGTFGREVPGTEHRIVDPESGAEMPPGQEGEVLVRGYSVMLGMYKRERSDVFDADGWYHTGDRGYFRDGWFFFTGRQSDLIKTSGSNVAPAEVEAILLRCPGVKLAFVVGVPHPDRGEDVIALVVPWAGAEIAEDELREQVRGELSSYKVPRRIFTLADADVPYLTSQKPDRRALATLAASLAG